MGIKISYMGTKRKLAKMVSSIIQNLPEGPVLDAFSGMCAVGEAIAPARQIWTNDIQIFPAMVAKALFCSKAGPLPSNHIKSILESAFRRNLKALEDRFFVYLNKEQKYLTTKNLKDVIAGNTELSYVGNDCDLENERKYLARKTNAFPYRLATITYVGSYFGVKQSMELDSLRYAIDTAVVKQKIDTEQRTWMIIALGQVASWINNSTGQFAQYIKPNKDNISLIIGKRRRSVWDQFFLALESISPFGTYKWRARNRSYYSDAIQLLTKMKRNKYRPTIVYADPPYSSAQYSRYYHVLDMLVEYRYPPVTGVGRYPDKRYQTGFAHPTAVFDCMTRLMQKVSDLKACLVLSYPDNGLFCQQCGNIIDLLKCYYKNVTIAHTERQQHSTFGGTNTTPKVSVVEHVYVGHP